MRKSIIYLLRHGEIDLQGQARFVGQVDLPLTEKGLRQAQWWKEELASKNFGEIYCSDLSRCVQTAEIVSGDRTAAVKPTSQFREIRLGEWDGMPFADVLTRYSDEWDKREQDVAGYRPPGGESFKDLHARVVPLFEEIAARSQGDALIVAHAGVNRVILCHVLEMPLGNLFRIGQDYGSLNIIDHERDGLRVRAMNLRPRVD